MLEKVKFGKISIDEDVCSSSNMGLTAKEIIHRIYNNVPLPPLVLGEFQANEPAGVL